jgi:hypothetical protein
MIYIPSSIKNWLRHSNVNGWGGDSQTYRQHVDRISLCYKSRLQIYTGGICTNLWSCLKSVMTGALQIADYINSYCNVYGGMSDENNGF